MKTFGAVTVGVSATDTYWVKAMDAANHATPTAKNHLAQNVNGTQTEKY